MPSVTGKGPYLSRTEAAEYLGLSVKYLERLHTAKDGPPCSIIGRGYKYPLAGLDEWVRKRAGNGRK